MDIGETRRSAEPEGEQVEQLPDQTVGESGPPVREEVDTQDSEAFLPADDEASSSDDANLQESSGSPGSDIVLRERELELVRAREHVSYLQEGLSALTSTGAEMAALLNWRTNAYNALTNGLRRLLALQTIGEQAAETIDASGYVVLPGTGLEDLLVEPTQRALTLSSVSLPGPEYVLPVEVTTLLSEVEDLTRSYGDFAAGRSSLEDSLGQREAEVEELQTRAESLQSKLSSRNQELSALKARIVQMLADLEVSTPQEITLADDAWDQGVDIDVVTGLDALQTYVETTRKSLRASQQSLTDAKKQNTSLGGRVASLEDQSESWKAQSGEIAAMVDEAVEKLSTVLSEDELAALRSSVANQVGGDAGSPSTASPSAVGAIVAATVTAVRRREKALDVGASEQAKLTEQFADAREQLQLRESEITDLQEELSNRKSESQALQDAKDATTAELLAKNEILSNLGERVAAMLAKLQAEISSSPESSESVPAKEESGIEEESVETGTAAEADAGGADDYGLGPLERRLDVLLSLLAAQEEANSEAEYANASLSERVAALQDEFDNQNEVMVQLQSQLETRGDELLSLRQWLKDVEYEVATALAAAGVRSSEDGTNYDQEGLGSDDRPFSLAALGAGISALIDLLVDREVAIKESEDAIASLEEQVTATAAEKQTIQAQAEAIQSREAELQSAVDDMTVRSGELDTRVTELDGQLRDATSEKTELADKLAQVEAYFAAASEERDSALAEQAAQSEKLEALQSKVAEVAVQLRSTLAEMGGEAAVAEVETPEGEETPAAQLAANAEALIALLKDQQQSIEDAEGTLVEKTAQLEELGELQGKVGAVAVQLRSALAEMGGEAAVADVDTAEGEETPAAQLAANAEALIALLKDKQHSIEDAEGTLAEKTAQLEELGELQSEAGAVAVQLRSALAEMGGEAAAPEAGVGYDESAAAAELSSIAAAFIALLKDKQQAIENAENVLTELEMRASNVDGQLPGRQLQLEQEDQAAAGVEAKGAQIQSTLDGLMSQRDRLETEVSGLRDRIVELTEQIGVVENDKTELADRLNQLEADYANADKDHEDAIAEKLAVIGELTKDRDALDGQVSSLGEQISTLQEQVGAKEAENRELGARLSNLESEAVKASEDSAAALAAKVAQINELTSHKDELDTEVARLNARLTQLNENLGIAESDRFELQEKLAQVERERTDAEKVHQAAMEENAAQIDELHRKIAEHEADIEAKDKSIEDLHDRIATLVEERQAMDGPDDESEALTNERSSEIDALKAKLSAAEAELGSVAEERDALIEAADIHMVNVPGTWQGRANIGCGEWDPACRKSRLRRRSDGTYRNTFPVPAGNYEVKVAINGSWDENYGAGGAPDGPGIVFSVDESGEVTFTYDPETHILTVS